MELNRLVAAVKEAQAALTQAEIEAENQTLRAPQAGRVTRLNAAVGQMVNPGDALAEIEPEQNLAVQFSLSPAQADRLRPGMAFTLGEEGRYQGSIIAVGAAVDAATGLVPVEGRLQQVPSPPYLGEVHLGEIVTSQTLQGVIVPVSALTDEDGRSFLHVVDAKGRAHRTAVELLARHAGRAAVQGKGLKAGQSVIVDGNYNLPDGAAVKPEGAGKKTEAAASKEETE
jgi:RND family efflux transporter MFP subunit